RNALVIMLTLRFELLSEWMPNQVSIPEFGSIYDSIQHSDTRLDLEHCHIIQRIERTLEPLLKSDITHINAPEWLMLPTAYHEYLDYYLSGYDYYSGIRRYFPPDDDPDLRQSFGIFTRTLNTKDGMARAL